MGAEPRLLVTVRDGLGATAAWSARNRTPVLVAFIVLTLVAGVGVKDIAFRTNVLEWLPENDANVQAFDTMLSELTGLGNLEVVYLELDPGKSFVTDVRDERAIRSQEELYLYVADRVPEVRFEYSVAHFVKLVNYANRGNDEAAYALPESSLEFQLAFETAYRTNGDTLNFSMSRDFTGMWVGFVIDGEAFSDEARDVGRAIRDALAAYAAEPLVDDLWKEQYVVPYGFGSGTALIDDSVRRDTTLLGIAAAVFVAACLLFAFRGDLDLVGTAIATLGVGLFVTYGTMGWLNVPLSIANVAIIPLLLGVGIDTALHVLTRFQEERGDGDAVGTARRAAERTGIPILLALTTTVAGLLAMAFSDSPGMTQLGLIASASLALVALLAFTFVPALLSALDAAVRPKSKPSRPLAEAGRAVAKHPLVVFAVVAVAVAGLGYMTKDTLYLIDLVQGNFPEDEPTRIAGERLQEQIEAGSLEFVIIQGDVTRPGTLDFIERIENETFARDLVARPANVVSVLSLLGSYETLRNGTVGAAPVLGPAYLTGQSDARAHAPRDQARVNASLTAMQADPAWGGLARILVNPQKDVTVIIVVPKQDSSDLASAQALWDDLHAVLDAAEEDRPNGVTAHVYGYRTIPFHFNVYSLFWLKVLFAVALVANVTVVALFTRSVRTVLAAATPMVVAAVAWSGLLAVTGTYVSIFLLFPMIFLTSLGSDYAAHLAWRMHEGASIEETFATTGRAVWWVMVTDAGAFALFTLMHMESATTIMRGATLAIVTAAVAGLLVTPLFFAWRRRTEQAEGAVAAGA